METLLPIIVQVVTGIIGGQAVGAAIKQAAMGQLPKILSGAIGGVVYRWLSEEPAGLVTGKT